LNCIEFDLSGVAFTPREETRILHQGEELQMLECNNCKKVVEIIAHTTRGKVAVSLCLDCIKIPLHEFNAKAVA